MSWFSRPFTSSSVDAGGILELLQGFIAFGSQGFDAFVSQGFDFSLKGNFFKIVFQLPFVMVGLMLGLVLGLVVHCYTLH